MFGMLGSKSSDIVKAMSASLTIIEFDPSGKILAANENFCRAMGYEPSEIIGQHHRMFVDPTSAQSPEYRDFWQKLGGGAFVSAEFKRLGKGGQEVWIQGSYNPVRNSRGKIYKVVKFAIDITEAKLLAAENAGKIAAIGRSQAIIEFTPDGHIVTANPNFLGAMGYDLDDVVGQHHRMFVESSYGASPAYAAFWDKLRGGEFVSEEFVRVGKGGRRVYIQASNNPIFDLAGKVVKVVKFATDVSERVSAVQQLGTALEHLADGKLSQQLEAAFLPALEPLRLNFNASVEKLCDAIRSIADNASGIHTGADQIRIAANDLAQRTEQEAAALEETSAALAEITAAVGSSSKRAEEAGVLVGMTKAGAERSGIVVARAVAAMSQIEESSDKIGKIIGVIDEIAFQTNLLALNAGIEAARAGEAGRGFAVVAQEVRGLAQRSAEAAKEIKALISLSGKQVNEGVALVGETGRALEAIVVEVTEIDTHVTAIVHSSRSQSVGLREINLAIGTLNQGTQQNAAMVEESTAASSELASEVGQMNELLGQFDTSGRRDASRSPALELVARVARDLAVVGGRR